MFILQKIKSKNCARLHIHIYIHTTVFNINYFIVTLITQFEVNSGKISIKKSHKNFALMITLIILSETDTKI